MEELAEGPAPLYDFLYRDPQRLASYYAQMFKGRLTQTETMESRRQGGTDTLKANVGFVAGDAQMLRETQESLKEIFDPHDMATVDLLSRLVAQMVNVETSIEDAEIGEIVKVSGRVVFLDKTMLEFAGIGMDILFAEEKTKPKAQRNLVEARGMEFLRKILPKMPMPSSFMAHMEDEKRVGGVIKDAGLDEPISAHYFKHGTEGIQNVQVIGIKEAGPNSFVGAPATPFMQGIGKAFRALEDIFFPPAEFKMTPVVIYREIVQS